jgi:peroxiredoxin
LGYDAVEQMIWEGHPGMSTLITPGDPAPDFEAHDVAGKHIRLSQFRGKPVVLAFLRGFM